MSIAHLLQDFHLAGTEKIGAAGGGLDKPGESFEDGYKAGWDDALTSKDTEKDKVSAALARSLEDLTFTYFEAKSAAVADFEGILEIILQKVLPEIAHETIGLALLEELRAVADTHSGGDIELTVNERDLSAVNSILPQLSGVSNQAVVDSDLPPGTVSWRISQSERKIDTSAMIEGVRQAVRGFVFEEKELKHA